MAKKFVTTMRLTEEAHNLLEDLSNQFGISHTALMELAIRKIAKRETPTDDQPLAAERTRRTADAAP